MKRIILLLLGVLTLLATVGCLVEEHGRGGWGREYHEEHGGDHWEHHDR